MSTIFVTGFSAGSAPVEVRERLAMGAEDVSSALSAIDQSAGVAEAMVLSTCNRVELWGVANDDRAARAAFAMLCRSRGIDADLISGFSRTRLHDEAVQHCFRVASSLDSVIVGEPQILGQVKDAFALARRCGTVGPMLDRLLSRTFSVAKRVRTETALGQHAVSVSFVAVELARKIFGDLRDRSALLIGAGEMGELSARHLVSQGIARLYVANRTLSKAEALADALGGTAIAFERRAEALVTTDIVITSTGAPHPIVTRDLVQPALAGRGARPLFLIDIAVPRDVEASVSKLPNVFCYDVDDLRNVVASNVKEREREAVKAEALVARETAKWVSGLQTLDVVPTIVSLRRGVETMREAEVAKAIARIPNASVETRQALEALSTALVNKILHAPMVKLREAAQANGGERLVAAVGELFDVEGGSARRRAAVDRASGGEIRAVDRAPGRLLPAPSQ